MITKLDIDLDYDKLLKEYYAFGIDKLIDENYGLKQLAIQCRGNTDPDQQLSEGCGSLLYDWVAYSENPKGDLPLRLPKLNEKDFDTLCDIFENTYFEVLMNKLQSKYNIVRGRFMLMHYKTCLTYHKDSSPRIHIPIYTNENCMMIIDDIVYRMPFGNAYLVDTTIPHTALNASKDSRVHLVFSLKT